MDPFPDAIPPELLAIPLPGPGWPLNRAGHLREHLVWMRLQGRAERTLFSRRRAVVRLAEFLDADPAHASYRDLYSWQIHLLATSKSQVRHQTAVVRPYFGWLHDLGLRADDPSRLLPMPKRRRGLPRPIPEDALTAAITQAPPRLLPWLLLAGWSGLRAAEIAHLRVDDFSVTAAGEVWVRVTGKGDVVRDAPVPVWAWPTISASLAGSGSAWRRERGFGPVTPHHVSDLCNNLLHRLGFDDTLHSLRHRAATLTYQRTHDIRLVQDFLGHLQADTTAIYTRVSPLAMAAAVNDLPHPTLPTPPGIRHLRAVDDTAHGGTA